MRYRTSETLLDAELEAVQTGCELVGYQVAQLAREDDDIVGVLVVVRAVLGIGIAERRAAITEAQNREEYLESALLVELIGDDRR